MELALTFTQNAESGKYEAAFKVESDWSLHIEKTTNGCIYVAQKSVSSGNYCKEILIIGNNVCRVYDHDFVHGHVTDECPKWIKLISDVQVTSAKVVADYAE